MQTDYRERYITMGLKIAYYQKIGLTQEALAEKVNVSTNFYWSGRGDWNGSQGISGNTVQNCRSIEDLPSQTAGG